MKRIVFAIALAAACGCDIESHEEVRRYEIYIGNGHILYVFEFEGHQYLTRSRGGITHSASCPCKKGGAE